MPDLLVAGVGGDYFVEIVSEGNGGLAVAGGAVPDTRTAGSESCDVIEKLNRILRAVGGVKCRPR